MPPLSGLLVAAVFLTFADSLVVAALPGVADFLAGDLVAGFLPVAFFGLDVSVFCLLATGVNSSDERFFPACDQKRWDEVIDFWQVY